MRPPDPTGELSRRRFVVATSRALAVVAVGGSLAAHATPAEAAPGDGEDMVAHAGPQRPARSLVPVLHAAGVL